MLDVLAALVLLMAGGLTFTLILAIRAPVGYEDEQGFHTGPEVPASEDIHGAVPHLSR